ncbi:sulfotransferase [Aromatoleum diolicum]|nr:sulfotransferase [Aromatoleum diolicum]
MLLVSKFAYQWMQQNSPWQVVFVAGMQRSGTNMLMDRLERSFLTDVYHERDPRAFDNYRMRDRATIRELISHSRAPAFVIKALCELEQLHGLMDEFAPAKTLWIVRDYRDAVRSALASFGNFTRQVQRIVADRTVNDWRAAGMSEATHLMVGKLWHPGMSEASAAALIWYFRNTLFFEQGLDHDARVRLIAYESLVQNPETECRSIFEFLEIPFTRDITRGVFSTSIRHRPLSEIEEPVAELCEGLARRFEACSAGIAVQG